MASRNSFVDNPIPLCDIESVLQWVDNFKLSRPTRKIARDFSDAVLLAEILNMHYPKLVDMHNYPPRNSQALKLNNWMTLNRKVLKKLKLQLSPETMEQLVNAAPGMIERILVMVREKIYKDEEALKAQKNEEQLSSGGSYYEACQDEENVLVVPVKSRVNGVLELVHQKVVSYNAYVSIKEELRDSKEAIEILKQKVDHLDQLMKIKEQRIEELQRQLERKAVRRKESETLFNNVSITFPDMQSVSPKQSDSTIVMNNESKISIHNDSKMSIHNDSKMSIHNESKISIHNDSKTSIHNDSKTSIHSNPSFIKIKDEKLSEGDFILKEIGNVNVEKEEIVNESLNEVETIEDEEIVYKVSDSKLNEGLNRLIDVKSEIGYKTSDEDFKDSFQDVMTIEEAVIREQNEISESLPEYALVN